MRILPKTAPPFSSSLCATRVPAIDLGSVGQHVFLGREQQQLYTGFLHCTPLIAHAVVRRAAGRAPRHCCWAEPPLSVEPAPNWSHSDSDCSVPQKAPLSPHERPLPSPFPTVPQERQTSPRRAAAAPPRCPLGSISSPTAATAQVVERPAAPRTPQPFTPKAEHER